jgi:predicted secreted Zn-dependent protease
LFDGLEGPVLLTACVLDAPPPAPLPPTVACRWPGLIVGIVRHEGPRLALDPRMLMGLLEGRTEGRTASAERNR